MNYWITTHWPQRTDQPTNAPHEGVWVQDEKRHAIDRLAPDDLVFIYETNTGRTAVRTYADGTTERIRCRRGRGGVVALVQVTGRAYQPEDSQPEYYADGTELWWRYYAPTESINSAGFVPRQEAAALLGYLPSYQFRGFGDDHSGLKQISKDLYERVFAAFVASAETEERWRPPITPRFGSAGEGPAHRELKERIAQDPARLLDEPGLRVWETEWSLPTSDRIDLVLKDAFDRFVAVEVEVDCSSTEIVGPLQCMKYRAMLSYFFNRRTEEVRSILVAHSIDRTIQQRCETHGIETKMIPR